MASLLSDSQRGDDLCPFRRRQHNVITIHQHRHSQAEIPGRHGVHLALMITTTVLTVSAISVELVEGSQHARPGRLQRTVLHNKRLQRSSDNISEFCQRCVDGWSRFRSTFGDGIGSGCGESHAVVGVDGPKLVH